jgi:hypothetical protein
MMAKPPIKPPSPNTDLKLLEDYYLSPEGLMIFTEAYHLKRGYCCGSGCLHCPYDGITVQDGQSAGSGEQVPIQCPFCFETFSLPTSSKEGETQNFVYDCEVCCHPIDITLHYDGENFLSVEIEKSN